MTKELYTTTDVKKVREKLLIEQAGIDPITGLEIPPKQAVTDHCHKSQFVRAVLHRQSNAVLGKLENMHTRYLAWWYPYSLSEFLRGCADYLDKDHPEDFVHPGWIKKVQSVFNALPEGDKKVVLQSLNYEPGTNSKQRKESFKTAVMSREFSFDYIKKLLKKD